MHVRILDSNDVDSIYQVMRLTYPKFEVSLANIKKWFPTTPYNFTGLFNDSGLIGFSADELGADQINIKDVALIPVFVTDWDVVSEGFQLLLDFYKEQYPLIHKICIETCATNNSALNAYKKLGMDVKEYLPKRANGEPGIILERAI